MDQEIILSVSDSLLQQINEVMGSTDALDIKTPPKYKDSLGDSWEIPIPAELPICEEEVSEDISIEDTLAGILQEHNEILEVDDYQREDLILSDDLLRFMTETDSEEEVDLLPESTSPSIGLSYPLLYLERVTDIEIKYFKQEQIFIKATDEERLSQALPLAVQLSGELVYLGHIIPSLKSFLVLRRLCRSRKIMMRLSITEESEITAQGLAMFLLEEWEEGKGNV